MKAMSWVKSIGRNEVTFWLGLAGVFAGLARSVSVETALLVVGSVLVLESMVTSYLVTWINARQT